MMSALTLFCCVSFLLLAATATAIPFELRQVNNQCVDDTDCNPESLLNVTIPLNRVTCNNGRCACTACFMLNTTTNRCYLDPPCTAYDPNDQNSDNGCIDRRQKQLTAFLLSFFLTWTGAANFYIERYDFAVPQLIFGIILCAMSCVGRCAKECVKDKDNKAAKLGVCCFIAVPTCLLSMMFFAWWITDLVYFGTNRRTNGDGCYLIENL
uniref:Uncharacterized protein n=1 Tax=Amphimedon queenslandica TaxID=400682 RepID=A0A1X7VU48_AMPQE